MPIGVKCNKNPPQISLKSRFQVEPGNAVSAALPQVSEAEPPNGHSQSETGNEVVK